MKRCIWTAVGLALVVCTTAGAVQAQHAQEARVQRNQPNLTIPVSNGSGRVVEHLQLAQ